MVVDGASSKTFHLSNSVYQGTTWGPPLWKPPRWHLDYDLRPNIPAFSLEPSRPPEPELDIATVPSLSPASEEWDPFDDSWQAQEVKMEEEVAEPVPPWKKAKSNNGRSRVAGVGWSRLVVRQCRCWSCGSGMPVLIAGILRQQ